MNIIERNFIVIQHNYTIKSLPAHFVGPIQHLFHMEMSRFKTIDELVVPAHFRSLKSIEHVFIVLERVDTVQ